jgi:hypothetical protein
MVFRDIKFWIDGLLKDQKTKTAATIATRQPDILKIGTLCKIACHIAKDTKNINIDIAGANISKHGMANHKYNL